MPNALLVDDCPVKPGKKYYYLRYEEKAMLIAKCRAAEQTTEFKDRYRWRAGVEATMSELDRRTGVKRLRVRGFKAVRFSTSLGETWEGKGDGIDTVDLIDRLEPFNKNKIDENVLTITAGVDVQNDCLELELVGWGIGQESWGLGYMTIMGDPERIEVWGELDQILFAKEFKRGAVRLKVKCT